jgi:glycosyltransferase involved in cell wall biosynthesis
MEAMACGRPVLTSAMCGVAEVVPEAMKRFVVNNPADIGEVAAKIEALVEVGAGLSAIARRTAEQFTWERHAAELLAIIDGAR